MDLSLSTPRIYLCDPRSTSQSATHRDRERAHVETVQQSGSGGEVSKLGQLHPSTSSIEYSKNNSIF